MGRVWVEVRDLRPRVDVLPDTGGQVSKIRYELTHPASTLEAWTNCT